MSRWRFRSDKGSNVTFSTVFGNQSRPLGNERNASARAKAERQFAGGAMSGGQGSLGISYEPLTSDSGSAFHDA